MSTSNIQVAQSGNKVVRVCFESACSVASVGRGEFLLAAEGSRMRRRHVETVFLSLEGRAD